MQLSTSTVGRSFYQVHNGSLQWAIGQSTENLRAMPTICGHELDGSASRLAAVGTLGLVKTHIDTASRPFDWWSDTLCVDGEVDIRCENGG